MESVFASRGGMAVEHIVVAGPNAFYSYCALVVYHNPGLDQRVRREMWTHFETDDEMRKWQPNINPDELKATTSVNVFLPVNVLCTLASRAYNLDIRLYSSAFEAGFCDYTVPDRNATAFLTLDVLPSGQLSMYVKHNPETGRSRVPTHVINVLTVHAQQPSLQQQQQQHQQQQKDAAGEKSQYHLAVYDSKTRTHMQMDARFLLSPNKTAHYMNFDLGLSKLQPGWNIILKGCKDVAVFIFAMQTKNGVRHAKYIGHWPVDYVDPFVTLVREDDGLIVVPVVSNVLSDAKKCVISEMRCVIE